jgi:hypothetical protein
MDKKQYYKYVITLDSPMWPRKIADELSFARDIEARLISVTDLQNDSHIYGDTYTTRSEECTGLPNTSTMAVSN